MIENFNLCLDVLKVLHREKVLDKITLIGSWCVYFYKHYFNDLAYNPILLTRDIDFLIPVPPPHWSKEVDLPAQLEKLGFTSVFNYASETFSLSHPQLIVEFLVPEQGRGSNKPFSISQLNIKAQRIRFLNYLLENRVNITHDGLTLHLPQPANFALHKLIVASRRQNKLKIPRDMEHATIILSYLVLKGKLDQIEKAFQAMPSRWRKLVHNKFITLKTQHPDLVSSLQIILKAS